MSDRRKTACVTGGNGYIASALVEGAAGEGVLREDNHDEQKSCQLKSLQASLGPLEVFRADLDEEGSFDDAVAGCDYAFLVSAPMNFMAEKLEVVRQGGYGETRDPDLLRSSTAAVTTLLPLDGDGPMLDEESWSDVEWLTSEKPPGWGYSVSKVLLEKEACRLAEQHGISLVTLCLVITVGSAPARKAHISVPVSLSLLSGDEAEFGMLKFIEKGSGGVPMVHVDDLCRAEMFVAEEAAAGRYICRSLTTTVLELARLLVHKYPQYKVNTNLSGDLLEKPRLNFSSAKLVTQGFQFKYTTTEKIYYDMSSVLYG
ncbi:hypothetical protein PR202_ga18927 [Eleusine coracana subsp. coracana]|uniref:NAD-dependent epimerase/dehydratase domain-containing protein n=1 Tax=Eleusine coracana subsp. coracana TaxID=191504 RepID=A0AAV5CUS4_ELECO|nr:hypothetical protein PR202_ga18927 [Eleusine coracana subsp. coracana]